MNTEQAQEIEKVEVYIEDAKAAVELADKFTVLRKMPEFELLITQGFMLNEPARIASVITDPNLLDDENQRELLGALKAVGYLGDYLRNIEKRGNQMRNALAQAENYQTQLRNPQEEE